MKPLAIVGPTAAGKTAVAVAVAEVTGRDLISFDSRQVYRGIEVSSNAPRPAELGRVTAHLVGVLDPAEHVTAATYVGLAKRAAATVAEGRGLVLTAGTGMYLKAYLEDLDLGGMGAVPELRAQLEAEASRDLPGLARRLQELSPGLAAQTDLRNPVRVVRRMELLWAAALAQDGQVEPARRPAGRVDAVKVGLRIPVPELERRISERVDSMLAGGWRREVEELMARASPATPQVMKSIGVAEMAAHIRGEMDEAETRAVVELRTRQYAKRQRTWFRGDPEVQWIDAGNKPTSDIVELILEMLN